MPLSLTEFLQLLSACAPLVAQHPTLRDLAVAQAKVESGFDPARISPINKDGLADYGLMQFHFSNLATYGMNAATALLPCQNLHAYQAFLTTISRYNTGDPTRGMDNGYVAKVESARLGIKLPSTTVATTACAEPKERTNWFTDWSCNPTSESSHP